MENLKKKIGILLLLSVCISVFSQLYAQEDKRMQRFIDEKVKYFNENLELSDDIAEKFWPIYGDLQNRRMKINEEERTMMTYYNSNSKYMSEQELDETIEKYFSMLQNRVDLDLKYHDKFVETIGKGKTMKMYALEREFRLHILEKFRGGPGGPGSRGRHKGGK